MVQVRSSAVRGSSGLIATSGCVDSVVKNHTRPGVPPPAGDPRRLVERLGECRRVKLWLDTGGKNAHECDLLEEKQKPLTIENGTMSLDLTPYEIKTVRLELPELNKRS